MFHFIFSITSLEDEKEPNVDTEPEMKPVWIPLEKRWTFPAAAVNEEEGSLGMVEYRAITVDQLNALFETEVMRRADASGDLLRCF